MKTYWHVIRKRKYWYVISLSLVTTVLLVSTALDFSEKIIKKPILLIISLLLFCYLFFIATKEKLWENEN